MVVPPFSLNSPDEPVSIHWFRRDLRWHDNRALHAALTSGRKVLPVFVFDANILEALGTDEDRRVCFLHDTLSRMKRDLGAQGDVVVMHGDPQACFGELLKRVQVQAVFANEDYEPYATQRDSNLAAFFQSHGVAFHTFKDHVVKAPGEVLKPDGTPYTVFTPFSKRWRAEVGPDDVAPAASETALGNLVKVSQTRMPTLDDLGFKRMDVSVPEPAMLKATLEAYAERRDIPSVRGTTRISVHLRFGTVSIREAYRAGLAHSDKWLTELIWREFYQHVMVAFPHSMTHAFRPAYDRVPWRHDDAHLDAWRHGQTGYPLVDAGMRELRATGFMHNRVRMVVASFLCKHLLLDWRLGERHFAAELLDFERASNVGGWQWAAGSGCDAAPYFRVFNPESQWKKFDPQSAYVRTWVPEFDSLTYPRPIVDHSFARQRAIDTYKNALSPG